MFTEITVPARTSSKRGTSPDKSLSEFEEEQKILRLAVEYAFKKVKISTSFDFKQVNDSYMLVITKLIWCFNRYWTDRTNALTIKKRSIKLRSKISMPLSERQKPNEKWERSDEYRKLTGCLPKCFMPLDSSTAWLRSNLKSSIPWRIIPTFSQKLIKLAFFQALPNQPQRV